MIKRLSKRQQTNSHIQGKQFKTISCFFSRNFAGQKGVAGCSQSVKRGKFTTKNTLPDKIIIHNWKKDKASQTSKS